MLDFQDFFFQNIALSRQDWVHDKYRHELVYKDKLWVKLPYKETLLTYIPHQIIFVALKQYLI